MKGFYIRWGLVIGVALLLSLLTYQDYRQRLSTVSIQTALDHAPSSDPVRIQGLVKSGTLAGQVEQGQATFEFTQGSLTVPVEYQGPPPENLRELKTLVLKGYWDPQSQVFKANDTALVDNYGYVAAAYAVSILVLSWVLFAMSRRVMVLFKEIKDSKLYEPEADSLGKE